MAWNRQRKDPQQERKNLAHIRLTLGLKIASGFLMGIIITLLVGIMGVYGVITLTKELHFIDPSLSRRIITLVLVSMILGVLISIALGVMVTRRITIPLKRALILLKDQSQGNLNPIETADHDEIEEMIGLIQKEMQARLKAEEASQAKSNFLATMSHELRTPLNTILGLTEIALQRAIPEDIRRGLEKIQYSGFNLLELINNILDISKIEAGSFELHPGEYAVPSLINDAIQMNLLQIGDKSVGFILEIDETFPSMLYGDALRVKQILNNLLSNAFKYTKAGQVTMDVRYERQETTIWMIVTVKDTGIGIRKEAMYKLFAKYYQLAPQVNRIIEGTGLGLFITKQLIDFMEGTITVESEYGQGSRFTVRIPQKLIGKAPIGKEAADNLKSLQFVDARRNQSKYLIRDYMPYGKVLVVDDVPTNLEVSRGLLKPYGLYVECVSSGQEAIDLIRKATVRFDLILMDHLMPDMDGITATQIIRHEIDSDYARRVPIIALTANALAGSEAMFLAQGFNAFISKPIDVIRLDGILNRWIRDKQVPETMKQGIQEKAKLTESPLLGGAPSILQESPIKGVDLAAGIARYEQEGIYLGILKSYLNHGKKILAQVRDVSQENLKEYGIAVHGLKGASYGIEADAIGKIAEEQERAAKAGDLERVRDQNPAFLASLHSLLEDISALLEKAEAPAGGKERLKVPDPELLEKLLEAGKHYKSTIMEEIITSLEQYEYEIGGALIPWLRKQIDNLEYEAIQNLLTKLKDADWRVESIWG